MPSPGDPVKKTDLDAVIDLYNGLLDQCFPTPAPNDPLRVVPTDPPCPTAAPAPTQGRGDEGGAGTGNGDGTGTTINPTPAPVGFICDRGNCLAVPMAQAIYSTAEDCSLACPPEPTSTPTPPTTQCYITPTSLQGLGGQTCYTRRKNTERRRIKNPLLHGGVFYVKDADPSAADIAAYNPLGLAALLNQLRAQIAAIVPNFCKPFPSASGVKDLRWLNYKEVLAFLGMGGGLPEKVWTSIPPRLSGVGRKIVTKKPSRGTLTGICQTTGHVLGAGDKVTYTPDDDFNGTDSFRFQMQDTQATGRSAKITVTVQRNLPIDVYRTKGRGAAGATLSIPFLASGNPASYQLSGVPASAVASINGDKVTVKTLDEKFLGVVSFRYSAISSTGVASSEAVEAVFEDSPLVIPTIVGPVTPTVFQNIARTLKITLQPAATGTSKFFFLRKPNNCRVSTIAADGTFTVTPISGFTGDDSAICFCRDDNGSSFPFTVRFKIKAAEEQFIPDSQQIVNSPFRGGQLAPLPALDPILFQASGYNPTSQALQVIVPLGSVPKENTCAKFLQDCEAICENFKPTCKTYCQEDYTYSVALENLRHAQALLQCSGARPEGDTKAEDEFHKCELLRLAKERDQCLVDCLDCKHRNCLGDCASRFNTCGQRDIPTLQSCSAAADKIFAAAVVVCKAKRDSDWAALSDPNSGTYDSIQETCVQCIQQAENVWETAVKACYSDYIATSRAAGNSRFVECKLQRANCLVELLRANNCQTTVPNCYSNFINGLQACTTQACRDSVIDVYIKCVDGLPYQDNTCGPGCDTTYDSIVAGCPAGCYDACVRNAEAYRTLCKQRCAVDFQRGTQLCERNYTLCNNSRIQSQKQAEALATQIPLPFLAIPKWGWLTASGSEIGYHPAKIPLDLTDTVEFVMDNASGVRGSVIKGSTSIPVRNSPNPEPLPDAKTVTAAKEILIPLTGTFAPAAVYDEGLTGGIQTFKASEHLGEIYSVLTVLKCCEGCEAIPDPTENELDPPCPPLQHYDRVLMRCVCNTNGPPPIPLFPPPTDFPPIPGPTSGPSPTSNPVLPNACVSSLQCHPLVANDPVGRNYSTGSCCCINGATYYAQYTRHCSGADPATFSGPSCCDTNNEPSTITNDTDCFHERWCNTYNSVQKGRVTLCVPGCGDDKTTLPQITRVSSLNTTLPLETVEWTGPTECTNTDGTKVFKWRANVRPEPCNCNYRIPVANRFTTVEINCNDGPSKIRIPWAGQLEFVGLVTEYGGGDGQTLVSSTSLCCGCCGSVAAKFPTVLKIINGIYARWGLLRDDSVRRYWGGTSFNTSPLASCPGAGACGSNYVPASTPPECIETHALCGVTSPTLPSDAFTINYDKGAVTCDNNNALIITLLQQIHADLLALYPGVYIFPTQKSWVNGSIIGKTTVTVFTAADFTAQMAGCTWFNELGASFDVAQGDITGNTCGLTGTINVQSQKFCDLVNATIKKFVTALQKLYAYQAGGVGNTREFDTAQRIVCVSDISNDVARTCALNSIATAATGPEQIRNVDATHDCVLAGTAGYGPPGVEVGGGILGSKNQFGSTFSFSIASDKDRTVSWTAGPSSSTADIYGRFHNGSELPYTNIYTPRSSVGSPAVHKFALLSAGTPGSLAVKKVREGTITDAQEAGNLATTLGYVYGSSIEELVVLINGSFAF